MVHFRHEHGQGTGIDTVVAVEGFVYHQFFPRFGVGGDGNDFIIMVLKWCQISPALGFSRMVRLLWGNRDLRFEI